MSIPLPLRPLPTRWQTADAFAASGWSRVRPEVDFGTRWGESETIRVSFAPFADRPGGFVYAFNRSTDQYLLLAPHTTVNQVEAVWRDLHQHTAAPDAYLLFTVLDHGPGPMNLGTAQEVFLDCLDRELGAYRNYIDGSGSGPERFDAAFQVIVARSARASSEQVLLEAAEATSQDGAPVVVAYRLLGETGWSGRLAGADLEDARSTTRRAFEIAERRMLAFQATSVSHGHTTLSAVRVPGLSFAAVNRELVIGAPNFGI